MTAVWLYGTHLGDLSRPRAAKLRFEFTEEAIARWGSGSTIFSMSMPISTTIRPTGDIVAAFFQNILPEGDALTTIRTMYRAFDDFSLIEAIGQDSAGALVVDDNPPSAGKDEPNYLTNSDVARLIDGIPQRPLGASLVVRHSLAGAQRKLLLGRTDDGRWYEASPSHPSTHLLKPAPFDHSEVANNEAFCMEVARFAGFETCETEIIQIESARVLLAKRFDRVATLRIHQEDGCQMLGIRPSLKYQRRKAGSKTIGPSLAGIAEWLSPEDRVRLLETQVLNVLVGNSDCHGKNVSILHSDDGTHRLAPLYDVMSTVVHHPILTANGPQELTQDLGMFIGKATTLDDVDLDQFVRETARWPLAADQASDIVRRVTARILQAVEFCEAKYPEIATYAYKAAKRML